MLNKSIEGTADDDEEGVTPDTAIRSGLELLKVQSMEAAYCSEWWQMSNNICDYGLTMLIMQHNALCIYA